MGTLSSELAAHAERLSPRPRIYADANVPAGIVTYMREELGWDVLFVIEDDDAAPRPRWARTTGSRNSSAARW